MESELEGKLRRLGFSFYEAKAYSSLLVLCSATMKEISEKSGIPYQKVYEIITSLEAKGLVRVIEGKPKRVKLIDPSISLKVYRDKIVNELDEIINYVISLHEKSKISEVDRSIHVKGRRTVIKLVKQFAERSKKMKVVYDKIPEWLMKILKQYNGDLFVITSKNIDLPGKKVDNITSRFIIFDDSLLVTFNGDDEIVIDSCKGCVIQAKEHFDLLTSKSE
ncbi:helix-turn-helix domain-containing protein [Sulfurisphaera javensis]|uniref:Helix-turn-helix domain-containing protein n=1 Tax=Sulfurisphaera javensis TaxID=2049879 RepID=A0AAT9GQG8_9CREN